MLKCIRKDKTKITLLLTTLQETFSLYLLVAVGLLTPAIILTVYILLTLPIHNHPIEESYMEYIAMIFMLVGFEMNYITVVNGCHLGKSPRS
jgi:hypothetical protein